MDHTSIPGEHTRLNPNQKGWYLVYLTLKDEGLGCLGVGYIPIWFTYPQTVTNLSRHHSCL